jgi:hypothetical protein
LHTQGPLDPKDHNYQGSKYNLLVEWEDGECSYKPLTILAADDPISCAAYAKRNGLLDVPGFKRFKRMANRDKKFQRLVNQAKLKYFRRTMKFRYGVLVPNTHEEAIR